VNYHQDGGRLTIAEQVIAFAWLPACQLGTLSDRGQYLALMLLAIAIFLRIVWLPLGNISPIHKKSAKARSAPWLIVAWSIFILLHLSLYLRAFGAFWGLKNLVMAISWIFILPAYVYLTMRPLSIKEGANFLRLNFVGLSIIILMNLVAYVFGVKTDVGLYGSVGGESRMLSSFGISQARVSFPFSGGVNNYAIIVGVASLVSIRYLKGFGVAVSVLCACTLAMAATTILYADSRAIILATLLAVMVSGMHGTNRQRIITFILTAAATVGPLILMTASGILPNSILNMVSRSAAAGTRAEALTSGRSFIWQQAFNDLADNPLSLAFGYGPYSQLVSAAGKQLSRFFMFAGGGSQYTFHSSTVQYIMDCGVVGVMVLTFFYFSMIYVCVEIIKRLIALPNRSNGVIEIRALLGSLIIIIVAGVTEAANTIYLRESQVLFIFVASAITSCYLLWKRNDSR
jgi:hypothetical protein